MRCFALIVTLLLSVMSWAQSPNYELSSNRIHLDSKEVHNGQFQWLMRKASDISSSAASISQPSYKTDGWKPAVVPGTVLTSLVHDKVFPEPYYGLNNRIDKNIIPDIANVGSDYYTYWFRTDFDLPASYKGKTVWLQLDGINYRAEIWLNGHNVGGMAGMFRGDTIDVTKVSNVGGHNTLAVKVLPVDVPGTLKSKSWGAAGEWHNGGDGEIGVNTTMLMTIGWDFMFNDGIRDRNTGIWRGISLYATNPLHLANAFVKSKLNSSYNRSEESVSVEIHNPLSKSVNCTVEGSFKGTGINFSKNVKLASGETQTVKFNPTDFPQLVINNPRLWWPIHKGPQNLYELSLVAKVDGTNVSDSLKTRFGIREIKSDRNTPDKSRQFYVNGKKFFVRGTNWVPEGMLRSDDSRTWAELRYNQLSGINFIRLWGGGIPESDYFYQLCDEMGFLVWQEFWITGDTKQPQDTNLYLSNVTSTVKRIRNHPCIAYYVASNESKEVPGTKQLINSLDGTRGYQTSSETDGVHDGSPYKQVNPMRHYENTASDRGSRIDGFNPEYGAPTIPIAESLREIMDEKDLWPINKDVWDYHDGGGFHLMTSLYKQLTDQYGQSKSIDEFAEKGQFVGAVNSKSIWESWNENKLGYGDRYCSGLLFWYQNCPVAQVCGRMYDHSLEPTASLYYTRNSLEPLHPQFDYLKNTVSVVNDYYQAYKGYTVTAQVYDINSNKVWEKIAKVDLPEDGVANDVIKIDFPQNISQVHFIKLRLFDDKGKQVGDNFYWRSKDAYKGKNTVTGPCVSGFSDLAKLKKVKLDATITASTRDGRSYYDIKLKNNTNTIVFFAQLQLQNVDNKSVKPCYFTDNFLCMLPGEEKTVQVDVDKDHAADVDHLIVKGWNVIPQTIYIGASKNIQFYLYNVGAKQWIKTGGKTKEPDSPDLAAQADRTANVITKQDDGTYTIADPEYAPHGWGIQGRNTIYESNNGSLSTRSWGTTLVPGFKFISTGDADGSVYIEYTWGDWTKGNYDIDNPSGKTYDLFYGDWSLGTNGWKTGTADVASKAVYPDLRDNRAAHGAYAKWIVTPVANGQIDVLPYDGPKTYLYNVGQKKYVATSGKANKLQDIPALVDKDAAVGQVVTHNADGTLLICDPDYAPQGWGVQGRNLIFMSNNGGTKTNSWGTTLIPGWKVVPTGDKDGSVYLEYTWGDWIAGRRAIEDPSNKTFVLTYGPYDQSTDVWNDTQLTDVANPLLYGGSIDNLTTYGDNAKWILSTSLDNIFNAIKSISFVTNKIIDKAVYNFLGQKVADDASQLRSLPKGAYIVGGRKLVVK